SLNTHAPDQTPLRSLLLQSLLDLTAPGRCYLKLGPIFMTFRGPEALTDTSEKIHFEGLLCQQPLQPLVLFAVGSRVRARTCRFVAWLNRFELRAPLVEAPWSYPKFSRQLTNVLACPHPLHGLSLKFPGVSLSLHCGFLSRKLCPILCATSRVHSILVNGPKCRVKKLDVCIVSPEALRPRRFRGIPWLSSRHDCVCCGLSGNGLRPACRRSRCDAPDDQLH